MSCLAKMTVTSARPDAATILRVRYVMVSLFLFGELDDFDAEAGDPSGEIDVVDDVFGEMAVELLEPVSPFGVRDRLVDHEGRPAHDVEAAVAAPTGRGRVVDRNQEDLSEGVVERVLDLLPLPRRGTEVLVDGQEARIALIGRDPLLLHAFTDVSGAGRRGRAGAGEIEQPERRAGAECGRRRLVESDRLRGVEAPDRVGRAGHGRLDRDRKRVP